MVETLVQEHRLSARRACRAVGLSRAAWYRPPCPRTRRDAEVIAALGSVLARHGRWGFWKCFDWFRLNGHRWNHKRVYRIYCALGLNLPRRAKRRVPKRLRQPLVAPGALNEIWALDFMRDALYGGRVFRTLNVIDEGNREALAIEVGVSIPGSRVVRVLDQLEILHGRPKALRLDNGPELTSEALTEWCKQRSVDLKYIQPGKPDQNAFIERFNRSYRVEVLDAYVFESIAEVQRLSDEWLAAYNGERPHESLGRVPPAVFMPRAIPGLESRNSWST